MIKILNAVQLCAFCNTIRKMLSTNVLCMKKRKKRSYYISEASDYIPRPSKDKRSLGDSPTMMQITEDTPPDMLAGAMDLTVHLPTGRTIKMSVERSTPMMDLLVQITTAHHLQHSGHILQALEMAPNSGHTDKVLPYKPNTPIGALDTQHVKVIPKNRSVPVPKTVSVGHQPFESTFRLQVHLPRNQLYVIRVSQNVHLEDIMKKVCEEKNLDSVKYEFRHPGNLDEVLDPKLTLSDYQITEVYIVSKGTVGLTQAFSSSDIMALRKEEERKQLQARTGGGVFSLIFKRGKPSMGSGSLSSENRSISPSHSDDSRSVTPPAIQQQILPPASQEPQSATEKPKPPQRKRRPAPKPPQQADNRKDSTDKPPSQISNVSDSNTSDIQQKTLDNGLTICHSRNSSDSSGYHEPSVLSDNCNTSLPRRPKSTIINEVVSEEVHSGEHSRSNGNLSKMASFSKSTTSITSRKKKAAPPPPPVLKSESSIANSEKASPVVASPLVEKQASPKPPPRIKVASAPPVPTPRVKPVVVENPVPQARNSASLVQEDHPPDARDEENTNQEPTNSNNQVEVIDSTNTKLIEEFGTKMEETQLISSVNPALADMCKSSDTLVPESSNALGKNTAVSCNSSDTSEDGRKPPEIVAVIPKKTGSPTSSVSSHKSSFDTVGRKRGFQIGTSMLSMNDNDDKRSLSSTGSAYHENTDTSSQHSTNSNYVSNPVDDYEVNDFNIDMFNSISKGSKNSKRILHELHGIHDLDSEQEISKNRSLSSLRSSESMPSFLESSNIKKWKNLQELDHISVSSDTTGFGGSRWVVGDASDTDSISTAQTKESPSATSSKRSSRQETKPDAVLDKPTTPTKESLPGSAASSKPPSRQESRSSIAPDNKVTTPPKESPRGSVSPAQPPCIIPDNKVTTPPKESPRGSVSPAQPPCIIPDNKVTTPPKESPRGSVSPAQPPCIIPDNKVTTPPKESPRGSVNPAQPPCIIPDKKVPTPRRNLDTSCPSSRKESKSSIVAENIETETVAVKETAAKIDQMEPKQSPEITPKVASPLPVPSEIVQKLCEAQVNEGNSKPDGPEELAELESEWQYQLPSPPTAFRDSSPTNMTDVTNYDTITLQDFKAESVVTNPELFEKLRVVKESQCETETVSDFNSVVSDEEKPMLSKLTLENLEKRKSLVYNRELSTSLKIAQENDSSSSNVNNNSVVDGSSSKRSSMLSELEEVIHNPGNKSLMRHNSCVTEKPAKPVMDNNLPNFKISTYDKPKKKINIFEDDSIRSNVENSFKTNSSADLSENKDFPLDNKPNYSMEKQFSINKNSYMGRSMENISYRKNSIENKSDEDVFKKPQEFPKFKSNVRSNFYVKHQPDMSNSVIRSESFSSNHNVPVWKPQNPVQRSKSQVALNRYRDEPETRTENEDGLSKSNSLFDVSGLQSLEVMRMIQTKLNTPSNSTEQLLKEENSYKQTSARNSIKEEESPYKRISPRTSMVEQDGAFKQTSARNSMVELEGDYKPRNSISLESSNSVPSSRTEPESTTNTKTYRYQGPPAINLSTWSERPKTKVSLKEDTDYKINTKDNFNPKIKLNASLSNGNVEIRHYSNNSGANFKRREEPNNVSIKVNGTEPIMTQQSGNVVIKIGDTQAPKSIDNFSSRFINHTTATGYRKPLANINKIDKTPRPHSVAFDSDFDISRVPIVRAVELKKTFKETPQINNTSVTQINSINNETTNKYADIYKSSESVNEVNGLKQTKNSSVYLSSDSINKPVLRVNSFAQNRSGPVVMGFRGTEIGNDNTARSRKSWNVPNSYGTLPMKVNPEPPVKGTTFVPNSNVPFSKISLKRIESNKVVTIENNTNNTNTVFGKVVLRNTSSQVKPNNNNRFSTGSPFVVAKNFESNKRYSNGVDSKEAPPPPPLMPKVTSVTKKVARSPESSMDSRGELLDSIRNFGGMKGLRNVKA